MPVDELITGERRGDTPVDDLIPGEVVSREELITGGVERRRDASGSAHHWRSRQVESGCWETSSSHWWSKEIHYSEEVIVADSLLGL